MKYWVCPCGCPMDRPMVNRDYWRCRFCGHQMDGWYPDVAARQEERLGTTVDEYPFVIHQDNDGRVFVECRDHRVTKYPFRAGHHFESPQALATLGGTTLFTGKD